ncbi:MAG: hypothetical protein NVS1B11_18130 [Terriglobales bacterium]
MRNANVATLAVASMLFSSFSLAWQIHTQKRPSKMSAYLVPARITELERKMEQAQIEMTRNAALTGEGLGIPSIYKVNPDEDSVVIQVEVLPASLPQAHDKQRQKLLGSAVFAVGSVTDQFDKQKPEITADNVEVIFLDLGASVDSGKRQIFATYKNHELSFH